MSVPVSLQAVAHHLPDTELTVAHLAEVAELPDAQRETCLTLGIERLRVDDRCDATDLAAAAAERALAQAGLAAGDLDALVVIESRAPRTLLSSEATRLQAVLGAHRAVTFSVGGLGCASLAPALRAARAFLADDADARHVLVAHGSKPATPHRYRHPVTVSGDGGQAVVIGRDGPLRVVDLAQQSNGDYWDLFAVHYRDRPSADWREDCTDPDTYAFTLAIETRNRLRDLYRGVLARNGMTPRDVDCHLAQNLSAASLRFIADALDVPVADACTTNLRDHGHLGPNDLLFNLTTAIDTGELGDGRFAVLLGASPVAAWSVVLVDNGGNNGDGETTYYL